MKISRLFQILTVLLFLFGLSFLRAKAAYAGCWGRSGSCDSSYCNQKIFTYNLYSDSSCGNLCTGWTSYQSCSSDGSGSCGNASSYSSYARYTIQPPFYYCSYYNTGNCYDGDYCYWYTNLAPSFSVAPSDGGSSSTNPTVAGQNVNFTGTATDADNSWKLVVCKTNSVTPSSTTPSCPGGNWCADGTWRGSGSQSSCSYTTQSSDAPSKTWYAFACDNHSSQPFCSPSSQGSGDNGSPFYVLYYHPCAAPASGDWTISQSCVITNEDQNVAGNTIITNTGTLDLRGESTIKFSGTPRYMYLNSGGSNLYLSKDSSIGGSGDTGTGPVGTWSTTTSLSQAMRENAVVTYNGYMYNTAGLNASNVSLSDVYYARIESNGTLGPWSSGTNLSNTFRCHGTTAFNGFLYTFGGYTGSAFLNTVYYAPISDGSIGSWSTTTALPAAQCASEMVVVYNDKIYLTGGYPNTNAVYYNTINPNGTLGATWTSTTALPFSGTARTEAYRGYLYTFRGGYANFYYAAINSNGTVGSWTSGPNFPTAYNAQLTNVVTPAGYLYVFGGNNGSSVSNQAYYIKINSNGTPGTWTSVTGLTAARHWGSGAYYKGYLYYLGGDTTYGSLTPSSTVYYVQRQ